MSLRVGSHFGPYAVLPLEGSGGMAEVYRARDTRLNREVALKVLPPQLASDEGRLARLKREAQLLASLNHPNIASIYGLEETDGLTALVLEFVPGPTLADRLSQGPIPIGGALPIARQVADALDAAHRQGIAHRDLKPSNIKLRTDGAVKVLDFGLAKAVLDPARAADAGAPTLTAQRDVVGTPAYMSPEQLRGESIDQRCDIWAFGCVLYEMLTGQRPFGGHHAAEVAAAVLKDEPDWNALPRDLSPSLRSFLHACLRKNPKRRVRDIGDMRLALDGAFEDAAVFDGRTPQAPGSHHLASRRRERLAWFTAALIALSAAGAITWVWGTGATTTSPAARVVRLAVPVSARQQPMALRGIALSADGTHLAYVCGQQTGWRLCVRALDGSDTRELAGTEGAAQPFFSPDGQWLAFFVGRLMKVPVNGGEVQTLADLTNTGGGSDGIWPADDTILFAGGSEIWRVRASGGTPERVTVLERDKGERNHRQPLLLPDGQTLIYNIWYGPGWGERQMVAQRLGTSDKRALVKGTGTSRYASTGHLIYTRAGALLAVRFDPSRQEILGAPVTLRDDLREGTRYADYDVSPAGMLAYVPQPEAFNRIPVLVDRNGRAEPLPGVAPAYYQNPTFSPDGRQVALMITGELIDIWVYDFARQSLTRLTTEGSSQFPVWSPDGKHIVYAGTRSGQGALYRRSADGSGAEERLTSQGVGVPWSIAPDGTVLAFDRQSAGSQLDIGLLPLVGDRTPRPYTQERSHKARPQFSPAGGWLAYTSNRSERLEAYVQSYPLPGIRRQISTEGGRHPKWTRHGRELFYELGRKIMSVEISTTPALTVSSPRLVVEGDYVLGDLSIDFDVHPDGQHLVMLRPSRPEQPVTHINVTMNWFEELKQRLPGR